MSSAPTKLGTQSTGWLLEATTVAQWRKGRGRCWRSPPERLEDANMKDVVDACSFWQQQTVRDVAKALGHLERAGEPRAELALWPRQQRLHRSMKDAEPHPIAHCKLQGAMVAVVVSLGIFLSLEKAFTHLSLELVRVVPAV